MTTHTTYATHIARNTRRHARANEGDNMTHNIDAIFATLKSQNDKTFTVAQCARVMKINEKIARRRMRANNARAKNDQLQCAKRVRATSRANVKYEYATTRENVEMIVAIIK